MSPNLVSTSEPLAILILQTQQLKLTQSPQHTSHKPCNLSPSNPATETHADKTFSSGSILAILVLQTQQLKPICAIETLSRFVLLFDVIPTSAQGLSASLAKDSKAFKPPLFVVFRIFSIKKERPFSDPKLPPH